MNFELVERQLHSANVSPSLHVLVFAIIVNGISMPQWKSDRVFIARILSRVPVLCADLRSVLRRIVLEVVIMI